MTKTINDAQNEFAAGLNTLLINIRDKAMSQFDYSVRENVPRGILPVEQIAGHAINHGVVSAMSQRNQWGIEPSIEFAADVLEDVNAHTEAAMLRDTLKQYA